MNKKIIVIGGGILGAATAYKLAKSGAEVVIIDRRDKGQATAAAAGIICPWLSQRRNKRWYQLAKGGARIYPKLIDSLKRDGETETGYSRVGAISLHTDEKKLNAMQERAIKRRGDAPEIGDVTLLNDQETKSFFPVLADGYRAVHVSGAARVNGRSLRDALLSAAARHGAVTIYGHADLLQEGENIIGAIVNGEKISADIVIAASGAWMNELLEPLGVQFAVTAQKAQIMHIQLPGAATNGWPVVMSPNNQYMLTFADRIVIGATQEDRAGFDYRVTAGGIEEILSKALQTAPSLAEGTILETRVGFRPFTPGFLPVIGKLPGHNGLLLANGLGASGLTMGPYIGSELAKLALGKELEINPADYPVSEALHS